MQKFEAPELNKEAFNCPHCGAFAQMWFVNIDSFKEEIGKLNFIFNNISQITYLQEQLSNAILDEYEVLSKVIICECQHCKDVSLWIGEKMVYPKSILTPPPTDDMPEEVKKTYNEASKVLDDSPRAACALLRLALEELLSHLKKTDDKYKTLNHSRLRDNIDELVKLGGISSEFKKVFDIVRIVGNKTIHTGELDIEDDLDIARALFGLLNLIIQETITRPKELDEMLNGVLKHPNQKTTS